MEKRQNTVAGSVKKPYTKPEIEVVNLDEQPKLLAGSYTGNAGFRDIDEEDI